MIRRFVCLLLVAVMLANQGLLFAHGRHAADGTGPGGHDSRSHVHLGGHGDHAAAHADNHDAAHSHHHSIVDCESDRHDGVLPWTVMPFGDHDVNAVYCAATAAWARDSATPISVPSRGVWSAASFRLAAHSDDGLLRRGPIRGQPASVFDAACPIYLSTRSLRI